MNRKRIFAIIGLVFAFAGVICICAGLFFRTENSALLNLGLGSTFIAFIFSFILNRKGKEQEESGQETDQ